MNSIEKKYADVGFLKVEDVMLIMQWSRAHAYKYVDEVRQSGGPFKVMKIAGTVRIEKDSFFNFLSVAAAA